MSLPLVPCRKDWIPLIFGACLASWIDLETLADVFDLAEKLASQQWMAKLLLTVLKFLRCNIARTAQ